MNCRDAAHLISLERDTLLDPAGRAALETHVGQCADCARLRNVLEQASAAWKADAAAVRTPNADLEWRRLRNRMADEGRPAARSYARWFALPAALAAAAAIALYVGPGGQSVPTADQPNVARANGEATASTVVFTDDKSGWTFVWSTDGGQTI